MTRREQEQREFELNNYISDKFGDIIRAAQSLKYAENRGDNEKTISKMEEYFSEVRRCYREKDDLEMEYIEEDDSYHY